MFVFIGITFAQVYIPTGVSTQSGILRNVPSSVVRIPANTYITDGNGRAYVATQVPLQLLNVRLNEDSRNLLSTDRDENLRRLIASEERFRNLLRFASSERDSGFRFDEDRLTNDREDRLRDWIRSRNDNDANSRQSTTLNRNQLRALTSSNRDNDADRFRTTNEGVDRVTDLSRFRDLSDLSRVTGRN